MTTNNGNYLIYGLTATQEKTLAVAPKCVSSLSVLGSFYVICKILSRDRSLDNVGLNIRNSYTNLLLGVCSADFISSIAYFLSTWPIPTDTMYSENIWGEAGNQLTCNIQGFMIQYGTLSSIMYTCSLSLHFLLRIRYKWSPSRLLAKAHPTMHFLCICLPLVSAILAWCKTLYNPTPNCCFIQSYPNICGTADSDACIRGANAMWYLLAMYQVPIFVGLFFIIGAMILIFVSLSQQDQQMSNFRTEDECRLSKQAFWLACQYVAAFCVAFVPVAVITIAVVVFQKNRMFEFILMYSILTPLQGFLTAIVYSNDLRKQLKQISRSLSFISGDRSGRPQQDREPENVSIQVLEEVDSSATKVRSYSLGETNMKVEVDEDTIVVN